MQNGATRQCQNFTFGKEKQAAAPGGSDSSLGQCLLKGARGETKIEVRDALLPCARRVLCMLMKRYPEPMAHGPEACEPSHPCGSR